MKQKLQLDMLQVNVATCDYCSYHVKRAYKAMSSKRSAIQSSFSGNEGIRSRLMDKVDPKGKNDSVWIFGLHWRCKKN